MRSWDLNIVLAARNVKSPRSGKAHGSFSRSARFALKYYYQYHLLGLDRYEVGLKVLKPRFQINMFLKNVLIYYNLN